MPQLWALKDIQQEQTATGIKIVAVTFQPCHLWLRYSLIEPKQHIVPVLKRGVPFHADKYFCFDSYHDNEQGEAEDTLTHTFIKEPWPVCETRWFYFYGTIAGQPSPSESPIFKKHKTYIAPPPPPVEFRYNHAIQGGQFIAGNNGWVVQAFYMAATYKLSKVGFYFKWQQQYCYEPHRTLQLHLHRFYVPMNFDPAILASAEIVPGSDKLIEKWRYADIDGYQLNAGLWYAIACSSPLPADGNCDPWLRQSNIDNPPPPSTAFKYYKNTGTYSGIPRGMSHSFWGIPV